MRTTGWIVPWLIGWSATCCHSRPPETQAPPLIKPYSIARSANASQVRIFTEAADRWNQLGQELLGRNVLSYAGLDNPATFSAQGMCQNPDYWGCGDALRVVLLWHRIPEEWDLCVATHEIGHYLGLGHVFDGIMAKARSYPTDYFTDDDRREFFRVFTPQVEHRVVDTVLIRAIRGDAIEYQSYEES